MDHAALVRRLEKLQRLLEVARAMTAERHLPTLLETINDAAAGVAEADRCSIFVVDRDRGELWTPVAHGTGEIRIPLGAGIAGAVAASAAPIRIRDAYADPRFNPEVDAGTGYRTRSILGVPMLNTRGEPVGVIQALNRRDGDFGDEDEELLQALAGPAASAIENAVLHEEIERLFEGFVQASVTAIEARDPTTAGHSGRVAASTLALARALEQAPPPPWRGVRVEAAAQQQLRYAALLHDFGKVGVREHVLTKADKLHPHQLELLTARFELARAALENERLRARLAGRGEGEVEERLAELEACLDVVLVANRPAVLAEAASAQLARLAGRTFVDPRGQARPLLTGEELRLLSIPRGSLSEQERAEFERRVELVSVGFAAEGAYLMVNFKAPPRLAMLWQPGQLYVVDQATGVKYEDIPLMPKIGRLIGRPAEEGQAGYVMLENRPILKPGAKVTVVLGGFRQTGVTVQDAGFPVPQAP